MNKSQRGFGLIELALIIIVVGVLCATGWYAFHTKHQTDKILSQSEKTSQSTASKASNSSSKYLRIKEWGVMIPYSGSDTYSYTYSSDTPSVIEISSANLGKNFGCVTGGAGLLARHLGTDEINLPDGDSGGTVEQLIAAGNYGDYVKLGDYYYSFSHDQSACSDSITVDAQNQATNTFQGFVKNIEIIPQ